ncbi:Short-chain dehydrogenase [Psilocybe cubensis]|uniref:Short-chain dehydrogenase n=2 Tax=Psilocybe cubensis TaxID=181762 RepID=A0ACB8GU46_PSICU|nr:Short-chain dehydrogenase [Psilocybe cubensis]KAH9479101.1 Short-chain dehydrogenase [Psilocybe cubensis]
MAHNKVAVVTGAAKGIGRGISLRLARDGYDLSVNDLESNLASLGELCTFVKEKFGTKAVAITGDISKEDDVKRLVQGTVELFGSMDVMIANAGICQVKSILETTTKDWDEVLAVNSRGTFLCYKYAAEQFIKQGHGGRIIGASSIAGKRGLPHSCAYSASKFAISSLTQIAAREWGKHGIIVNAYAPGPIETDMSEFKEKFGISIDFTVSTTVLGYNGTPDDIAGLVSYLVSDNGRFITGQVITIDGGVIFQ